MNKNKAIKKIWKSIMYVLVKIYTHNYKLYIQNSPSTNIDEKHYSQYGQDIFVLNKVFHNKKEGVFVDVGGNHPIHGSNTYLLEQNGWTGIAIEPQKKLRDLWPEYRTAPCLPYVIGPENKEVTFIVGGENENGVYGVEGFNKVKEIRNKIVLQQKRLDDVLTENNIKKIDYVSIDVEGYELNVLKSIDFSKTNITLIGVENDIGFKKIPIIGKRLGTELGNNEIRKYLKNQGYEYIARIFCDDFFIKKEEKKSIN